MDPFSGMLGIVGLGLQLTGGLEKMFGASEANAAQGNIIKDEMAQDQLRREFMENDANRKQMQVMRNVQQARAIALNNSVSQGAGINSSGLQGGYGQISGEGGNNMEAINQALMSGRKMFNLNADISQNKLKINSAEEQMQMGSGLAGLGNSFISAMGPVHKLTGWGQSYNGNSNA